MNQINPAFTKVLRDARWYDEMIRRQAFYPDILKASSIIYNDQILRIVKQMPLITSEFYEKAIKPLLEVQERNSKIFQNIIAREISPALEVLANQNNLYMTKAINDIMAIRHHEFARLVENMRGIDFAWLAKDLSRVTQAYSRLYTENISTLETSASSIYTSQIAEAIVEPTATVSHYVDSARNLVEAETESNLPALPEKGYETFGDEDLDPLLYQLNPDFVEMRQGSWSALSGAGPDRLRHAAISQRELIRQLLEHYVPNASLPKESRQGPRLKARIRIALNASEGDAEYVEAMGVAVMSSYNQLNKYTHHNERHEDSLRALLQTGEGLIHFILALAQRKMD